MILIIGGAGYIGSHINKMLNQLGHETIILDNLSYGHKEFTKWGKFIEGDINETAKLERIFQNYPVDSVMHFAAFTYVGESVTNPQKYYVNNVKNTLNLLETMNKYHIKNFIFSSTCAVYGEPQELPLKEDHPLNPINPYGRSKLMIENILKDYSEAYDFNYASLRYFNAAGADPEAEIGEWHDPETHLIPLVLDAASGRRDAINIFGTDYPTKDGTCIRDYIHVCDLAQAHLKALDYLKDKDTSEIFNLGNGNGFSVREVIETAARITGQKIKSIEDKPRAGDPPILIGSAAKAKKVLGWKPHWKDLSEIIETSWKWHQRLYGTKDKV
ncbi:UDP-glucose 4-epimerase GalE [Methanobacterium alcaliphilum]|uniref:UDP-glucose 4-epimerase GalE n=1 Tax=Methanobacterium alcaliphilum TaxID=392018 RepID=UPI00200B3BCB|nr:UDP-glucose 4-epimerase GalE [Methanobacterium alcaliphilum]MCK9150792.1 UDP-glucose 4-epimerase GalE [Methanobacterium alcaliphilum]